MHFLTKYGIIILPGDPGQNDKENKKMTLRELLSCYDENCPARIKLFDREWNEKILRICFNPGSDLELVYEDDMIELDAIADCKIIRWYSATDGSIRVMLDTEFEEVLR